MFSRSPFAKIALFVVLLVLTSGLAACVQEAGLTRRLRYIPRRVETEVRRLRRHSNFVPTPVFAADEPAREVAVSFEPTLQPTATPTPSIVPTTDTPVVLRATQPASGPTHQPTPASPTPSPTSTPTPSPAPPPPATLLGGFTHAWQTWNNCGPATLAMNLSYFGRSETQADAATVLKPDPDDKNVSPDEMVAYARSLGFEAIYRVGGDMELLKRLLSYGIPVITEVWLFLAPRWGVHGLAVGVVAGAVLHLGVKIPGLVRYGMQYSPILGLRHPGVRQVTWLMGPRVLALGVVKLTFLVNTNLASRLGEGSVAALSYAWHVMQLPETLFATAVAIVIFPTLAEFAARDQTGALRSALADTLRMILVLTVPAAVGLIVLGRPLVALLFQRGAFDARSTEMVYFALQFYALALVGHAVLEIAARLFYAQKDTLTPLKVAVIAMLANVALSLTLIRVLSYGGLALANALAFTLEASILLWIGRSRLGGLDGGRVLDGLVRIGVAALVMGATIIGFQNRFPDAGPLVVGTTGLALGGLVYLAAILALGLDEARTLPQLVVGRVTR